MAHYIAEKESKSGRGKVVFVKLPTKNFAKADKLVQDRPKMFGVLAGPFRTKREAKAYHVEAERRFRKHGSYA